MMNELTNESSLAGGLFALKVESPKDGAEFLHVIGRRPSIDQAVDSLIGLFVHEAISDIKYHVYGVNLEESGTWSYGEEVEGGTLSDGLPHSDDLPIRPQD